MSKDEAAAAARLFYPLPFDKRRRKKTGQALAPLDGRNRIDAVRARRRESQGVAGSRVSGTTEPDETLTAED